MLLLLLLMTLARFVFFWAYNPPGKAFSGSAFLLGLRYDARVVSVIGLLMMMLCAIPVLNPFRRNGAKKFWNFFLPFLLLLIVLVYISDFYHYDYLQQRLNATVLNFVQDAQISMGMMWETYPLLRILGAVILLAIATRWLFGRLLKGFSGESLPVNNSLNQKKRTWIYYAASFLLMGTLIFGKIGQYPLRWSDAYSLSDDFKASLALNPIQSFISTMSFRNSSFDIKKVREAYPLMADYLQVQQPDSTKLNYTRSYEPATIKGPNIVLVICESFSAYKSSMYGNPLNTTPYFNQLCKEGVFFDRCFTPSYGTARGVWATITGIPDVENPRTASRNPGAVDQHSIINDFEGYNNFYFLGGSANWANIRGLLTNNIRDLKLYEQEDYSAKKIDVWGISDKNLFLEANKVLKEQKAPFFAIIQTADNHRPYTIPAEDKAEFKLLSMPDDSLHAYGFESLDEMNAFRYTDFCFQKFMEAAKKEAYFNNTVFVYIGDHGIGGNAQAMFPKAWTDQGFTAYHVPLLFYAPGILKPQRIHDVCSQVDVLPTLATFAGVGYNNTALGRALPLTGADSTHQPYAFIINPDLRTIGMMNNDYYYSRSLKSGRDVFVSITGNEAVPENQATKNIRTHLQRLTDANFETAKYLLLNNRKR